MMLITFAIVSAGILNKYRERSKQQLQLQLCFSYLQNNISDN